MKGTLTIIKADGSSATQPLDKTPEYEAIKAGLDDGWLEAVPLFNRYKGERCVVFADEEGRLKGLPHNAIATALWHETIRAAGMEPSQMLLPLDVIGLVGPIVIISGDDELLREV